MLECRRQPVTMKKGLWLKIILGLAGLALGLLGEFQPWVNGSGDSEIRTSGRWRDAHPGQDADLLPSATPPRDNVEV